VGGETKVTSELIWVVATQRFLEFCTPNLGEDDFQFDEYMFQMGWFNHQPASYVLCMNITGMFGGDF